jgi:hypothetical protein
MTLTWPAGLIFTPAVLEVQHWIAFGRVLVIIRGRVNKTPLYAIGTLGVKKSLAYSSMRDILDSIEILILGWTFDTAAPTAGAIEEQTTGIRNCCPVNPNLIIVKTFILRC